MGGGGNFREEGTLLHVLKGPIRLPQYWQDKNYVRVMISSHLGIPKRGPPVLGPYMGPIPWVSMVI